MKKVYIGIDPGISGGIGAVDEDGNLISAHLLPVVSAKKGGKELHLREVCRLIEGYMALGQCFAAIEKVHAMPKQGVRSVWRFAQATGQVEGVIAALRIPYFRVPPQRWQKEYLRFTNGGADKKQRSVMAASELFPDLELPRKKDHNKAESVLIADFCRKHHNMAMED